MKLDVCAGYQPVHADDATWLHVDISPHAPVEVVADGLRALPFRDGTFTEIHARDCIEHTSYRWTGDVLAEWCRVLVPGGRLFIQTPDADLIMRQYVASPSTVAEFAAQPAIVTTAWKLLGGHDDGGYSRPGDDWRWNGHYALLSEDVIRWHCGNVGLVVESVERNAHPNLFVWCRKPVG